MEAAVAHLRRNAIAYVALFLAMGLGTAWAVERNSVRSKHIVNGQVKPHDIGKGAVGHKQLSKDAAPRWGTFSNSGGVIQERGVVDSEPIETGVYEVEFDRNVSSCAWSATLAQITPTPPEPGEIAVRGAKDAARAVIVHTLSSTGSPEGRRFHLVVNC